MMRLALLLALGAGASCSVSHRWRAEAPEVTPTTDYRPAKVATQTLANGVGVYTATFKHPATTRVGLVFGHGYADDEDALGRARLLGRWLKFEARGVQAERFELVGADLRVDSMPTATVLEVDVLHADARAALEALRQLVETAGDEATFEDARRDMLAELAYTRRTPSRLVELAALQSALPTAPRGLTRRGHGSAAFLQEVRFEEVVALRDRLVASVPASVALVGPQAPEQVSAWAEAALSSWGAREPTRQFEKTVPRRPKTIIVVPVAGMEDAVVYVGTTAPRSNVATRHAHGIGSWLAHYRLREDQQRTYGVRSGYDDLGHTSFAYATARVPSQHAYDSALTIAAAFGRARRYANDEMVQRIRRTQSASWIAAKMETEPRANGLYRAIAQGEDPQHEPPFGRLERVSAGEIQNALGRELSYDGMQIVIAGDLDRLRGVMRGAYELRTDVELLGVGARPLESGELVE